MTITCIRSAAILSEDGLYRYRLDRWLTDAPPRGNRTLGIFMVNPSTADAEADDPTIRRVLGFAHLWGFGHVTVGNLFAYRATEIRDLLGLGSKAIGQDNNEHLRTIAEESEAVVVAWGPCAKLPKSQRDRWKDVVRVIDAAGKTPFCIGRTAGDGQPRHPLMLAYSEPLTAWEAPWFVNRHPAPLQPVPERVVDSITPQEAA